MMTTMSREHATPDELDPLQYMYGGCDVELPHCYEPGMAQSEPAEYARAVDKG
jgi:hypothetical protein